MGNTFDAVPRPAGAHERSTASLSVADPQALLERIVEEAGKHRGTLRERDGCTIPFREGGSVRIRVGQEGQGSPALHLATDAPTVERREHLERTVADLLLRLAGDDAATAPDWQPAG